MRDGYQKYWHQQSVSGSAINSIKVASQQVRKCASLAELLFSVSNLFDRYIMNILVLIETGSRPDPECFLLKPVTCYYVHDHIIKRDPMLYTCYFAEIFVKIPGVYYGIPSPIFTCKIKTCL